MLHMHESLGGAFPKRHHVDGGVTAIIRKVPVLGRYNQVGSSKKNLVLHKKFGQSSK
jgi:hypothetical protein